jgi:hypothetical protein
MLEAWRANALRGRRKLDLYAFGEDEWLELLRGVFVHHWAVPIPIDVRTKALQRIAP